ncbi:putative peroxisomal membrane protein [Phaeomoniella chlamydospora]|uniref:Peroxisomal membrane protein PEX13 n=1 Tax=Phaeomoniella chlamydospora TaxID=158046 RepID=A0A0G2EFM5_PHACM|nr:putative peroxisomal membrane protein [Phaeomoniella chlamydospora]
MATVSPPKPWERGGTSNTLNNLPTTTPTSTSLTAPAMTTTTGAATTFEPPALPDRPNSLTSVVNQTASNYSPYGANRLGTGNYGGYGGISSYSSPYSRFGMNSMYGGYGGYGGMYGGGMYGGGYGGMMGPNQGDPNSLTNSFNQSTQATFQIIESIVGAFGGFAQMLESTYMATHSSFFAMVSVAEQFGNLRNTLGSVLGIFTLMRWLRTLFAKLAGRPPPADATALTPSAFASFISGSSSGVPATLPDGSPDPPRPSKKPFIMFLVAVFGLPYLMGKLIRALARSQEEEMKRQQGVGGQQLGLNGQPAETIDPSKLDFCRVLYDYTPANQSQGIDLPVKKGDLVAVLSKTDPMGNPSEWWHCRARSGDKGYLPSPYLETLQRKPQQAAITAGSAPGSRTTTLKGSVVLDDANRTRSLGSVNGNPPEIVKVGDISSESFQKSAFYS